MKKSDILIFLLTTGLKHMSSKIFNSTQKIKVKRTKFNLSHSNMLTMNMGTLTPIFCKEVLPGDQFSINANAFIRFAPMVAPVMSDVKIAIHFWYVNNRILWDNWKKFITEEDKNLVQPYFTVPNGVARGSILDYMGLPANTLKFNETTGVFDEQSNINPDIKINALPFRAYNLIYNEFYRDEELQEEVPVLKTDGLDETEFKLLRRAWAKDYFTSARPQAQLGDGVSIPLGVSAPVIGNRTGIGILGVDDNGNEIAGALSATGETRGDYNRAAIDSSAYGQAVGSEVSGGGSQAKFFKIDSVLGLTPDATKSGLIADLSNASAIDIIKLRLAGKMQQALELKSRIGNRYNEMLQGFFATKPKDASLQLPQYLGGSVDNCVFSEVIQTSETTQSSPQGNMSGHGVGFNSHIQVKNRFISEHGWIIGIMNVQPKPAYCQGVDRQFTRETCWDYGFPIFQHIGEQDILEKEINGNSQTPDKVWGHAPRYAEYKNYNNQFHGDFCGNKANWHLGRISDNGFQLNGDFVECNPSDRIFSNADDEDNKLYCKVDFNISAIRSFDFFSNPGISKF